MGGDRQVLGRDGRLTNDQIREENMRRRAMTGPQFIGHLIACAIAVAAVGCAKPAEDPKPLAITPPSEVAGAAVARRPIETPPAPPTSTAKVPASTAPRPLQVVVPPNAIYVCVIETQGSTQQTAIDFVPKVEKLCRKHPEMGPCQYERNNCRASGGRVFAAGNIEITMATEAEYDKKVMRTRFRAN